MMKTGDVEQQVASQTATQEDAVGSFWHWLDVGINSLGAILTSIMFWKGAAWLAILYLPVWIIVGYIKELAPFIDLALYDKEKKEYRINPKLILLLRKNAIRIAAFVLTWMWAHAIWIEGFTLWNLHEDKWIILLALFCPFVYDGVVFVWRILKWASRTAYKFLGKPILKRVFPNLNVDELPDLPDIDDLEEKLLSQTSLGVYARKRTSDTKVKSGRQK